MKIWRNKKLLIGLTSIVVVIALIVGGCAWYVSDYYRADTVAIEAFMPTSSVKEECPEPGILTFGEGNEWAGLIFYPGGKVEYTAYVPLMRALAAWGVFCVLVEMPFNLAVLDMNAADGILNAYPEIESWYIGGHSLGGAMAASYVAANADRFEGLVLLAAYSSADLSGTDLRVLSVFGSEDGVMNREKYDGYRSNLPTDFTEAEIGGGCHAYFGMYGEQDGDGAPTITPEDQICQTADHIMKFVLHMEV